MEVIREANFYSFWLYLECEAFMLIDHEATIASHFFIQIVISRTARDVESYILWRKVKLLIGILPISGNY